MENASNSFAISSKLTKFSQKFENSFLIAGENNSTQIKFKIIGVNYFKIRESSISADL